MAKPEAGLTTPGFTPGISLADACLFHVLLIGNSQFPAALRTAAAQYPAAVLGAHALTEAMLVGSFSSRRLESPFHFIRLIYGF
jgi:hypothetical protein